MLQVGQLVSDQRHPAGARHVVGSAGHARQHVTSGETRHAQIDKGIVNFHINTSLNMISIFLR